MPGTTDSEIRLAVITEDGRAPGMRAWAASVNRAGGIAGRTVRLDRFATGGDPQLYERAVRTACAEDFAIVGSATTADSAAAALAACGIPDLPVRTFADAHTQNRTTFPAIPHSTASAQLGGLGWLVDNVDGCCAAHVVSDAPDLGGPHGVVVGAAPAVGVEIVGRTELPADAPEDSYGPVVTAMRDEGATLGWSTSGAESTVALRKAAATQGIAGVVAWYCDSACYSPKFVSDGGPAVEGEYVQVRMNPIEEAGAIPALARYVRSAEALGGTPSPAGLRGYVAGLLFERAAEAAVDGGRADLTRAALLGAVMQIHDFDAGGIVGATDVATKAPNGCFALLKVTDGEFARVFPVGPGELSCGSENLVSVGP